MPGLPAEVPPVVSPGVREASLDRGDVDLGVVRQAEDLPRPRGRGGDEEDGVRAVGVTGQPPSHLAARLGVLVDLHHVVPARAGISDRELQVRSPLRIDVGPGHGVGVRPVGVEDAHGIDLVPEQPVPELAVAPDVRPLAAPDRGGAGEAEPPGGLELLQPPLGRLAGAEEPDPQEDGDPEGADLGEPQEPSIPRVADPVGGGGVRVGTDGAGEGGRVHTGGGR